MRLSELQDKDVVNVNDGKKIGNIIDIIIGSDGTMNGLVIEKSKFLVSLFTT
ncbi:MAG TPA: YlmC/YmxH family sporulation protein, partial [Mollicutes bacterium]|nr:YlmC/YmxH family sporulation protein [Mollicutes bacterium]